ncbi:hypothetical protein T440DRAFT_549190 [Plenodomus tracheiphilus IPT5]|uniref:Indole-diterpene biosynthesis protein-like protein PaxU n=1 Tax=Plenodomus tracheiphilus IPT5 TaxID=1408161 RepID=A0A6A7AMP4_9PLEO|nr:hypothetical protein T440DRAFT_549190 [Plenodomus tracheiphilus IPT5]
MTTTQSHVGGIPGFALIAPSIWEHKPSNPYHLPSLFCPLLKAPSLVVLCTWTGAQHRHIATYTAEYQRRFPSTRIMVITTSIKDLCFRTSEQEQKRLRPAVDRIASYQRFPPSGTSGSMLMHVFSEGGSHKACELAEAYHDATATRLLVAALCLDSTPGCPRYFRLCQAVHKALPPTPLLRYTGLLVSSAALGCIWVFYHVFRGFENNVVTSTRAQILDPTYWDLGAPRCYLYSNADAIVWCKDIDSHAIDSISKGIPVMSVRFGGSDHVRHALHNWEIYWAAVMETWRSAGENSNSRRAWRWAYVCVFSSGCIF